MANDHKFTSEECVSIMQQDLKSADFEMVKFAEKPISDVDGQMGVYCKLHITVRTNNGPLTKTFFVKRMCPAFAIQRAMIRAQGAYDKEHFAYTTFQSLFTAEDRYRCDYMAACYFTIPRQLLVFEDLSTQGYIANKYNTYKLDLEHVFLCLDAAAKFHAGSMIHENHRSKVLGRPYKLTEDYSQYLQEPLYRRDPEYLGNKMYKSYTKAVTALIDLAPQFEGRSCEVSHKFLRNVDHLYDLVAESDKFCNVICHGDLWMGNLLFKYLGDIPVQCKIIDYQALRYTVPAHDFLYLAMVFFDEYEKHFDEMKWYYYKCLQKYLQENGIDINERMTYEQFGESIQHVFPYIIVQKICFSMLRVLQVDGQILEDENIWTQFMYENMAERCVKNYHEHACFKGVIDKIFKDLDKLQ